uniref:egl nine homolog 1-like n=1 Tax=Styela clava TaxID=7725 RepID=UPI00193959FE|nr:egl nine homolog 1-like [Styela clava]
MSLITLFAEILFVHYNKMPTCAVCDKLDNLKSCSRCGSVEYCGREHQTQHWKVHKKDCKKQSTKTDSTENSGEQNENSTIDEVAQKIKSMNLETEGRVAQNSIPLNPYDSYTKRDEGIVARCHKNLVQRGICVIDTFVDENRADLCLADAMSLYSQPDKFKPGEVIKQAGKDKIRGDEIIWLSGSEPNSQNINYICRKMDKIISKCHPLVGNNDTVSHRTKAMLACYPGNGTAYKCHIDNPSGDGRWITAIYYMNKGWDSKTMGGNLHIHATGNRPQAIVEPKFNRLLLFFSDSRNPHEVRPAYARRFAVTIWYFKEEERRKALEKWQKKKQL